MRLVKERVKEEVTYMDERGYMVTEEKWVEKEVMKEAPPTPPSRPAVRAPVAPKHSVAAALAEAAAADDDDDDAPAGKKGKAVDPTLLGFSVESSRLMQGEILHAEN